MHCKSVRTVAGGLVSLALVALAVPAASPAASPTGASPTAAFVRVEGAGATLLPQTLVATTSATKVKGNACPGTSTAGALDVATNGNWSGSYSTKFNDYLVGTLLGETPSGNNFWTLWVNGRSSSTGACATALHPGDHVLWFDCQADANFNCTNNPLSLSAPAVARRGSTITVRVSQLDGAGHSTPTTAVAVSGQGAAGTSNASGAATLVPRHAGIVTLQATKSGATPSDPLFLCVYAHRSSECGSANSGPRVHVNGIAEHQQFKRSQAPRELIGTAGPDPSGLTDVSLSLVRHAAKNRCSYYDGDRGTFRTIGCHSTAPLFSIGASASWSYLLPRALGPGQYRLVVQATDGAGRRTKLATGGSELDFTVK